MAKRRFPIGIQAFSEIKEGNYIYVDKTNYIYSLVHDYKYVFLIRPRRFGKSLLSSTLQCYFEGRKELFEGLAIDSLEKDWTKHPVLYFDFSTLKYTELDKIGNEIKYQLSKQEEKYGITENYENFGLRLKNLISTAYEQTGEKVVLIIDEYDCPLLEVMHDVDKLNEVRDVFRAFYSPIKGCDNYLQFVFLTGVTKFSQLTIFSEFNNLMDISMLPEYSGICGITKTELETQLISDVENMAIANGVSTDEMLAELRKNYDGYHFSSVSEDIFNPFSLLKSLSTNEINSYWFATGTSTFLIRMMEKFDTTIDALDQVEVRPSGFDAPTAKLDDAVPLFYQSGYLTIKDYDKMFKLYTLGIPNEEVRVGLCESLLPYYSGASRTKTDVEIVNICKALKKNDLDQVLQRLKAFYASIPNDLENKTEKHYQTIFFVIFSLIGAYIDTEVKTAVGRADAVVKTDTHIYVIEMKLDSTADNALKQIDDKDYMLPYSCDGRELVKIGINFDSTQRTLSDWIVKEA